MWKDSILQRGFAIIPDVLAPDDLSDVSEELGDVTLRRTRAGIRHALQFPSVEEIAADPRVLGIARSILGSDAFPFRATLFDKSPESNWLVVWHQDTALPLESKHEAEGWGPWSVKDGVIYAHAPADALSHVLALRIHLDDSNAKNGPLRVLPSTHARGVLSDTDIHQLAAETTAVDCTVPKCGVVAIRPLIVHASSKSQSDDPRRVLHIEYASSRTVSSGRKLAIA